MKKLQVQLRRSVIGCTDVQRATVSGLGLRKPNSVRVLENTPAVRGMISKVLHLVQVSEIDVND